MTSDGSRFGVLHKPRYGSVYVNVMRTVYVNVMRTDYVNVMRTVRATSQLPLVLKLHSNAPSRFSAE